MFNKSLSKRIFFIVLIALTIILGLSRIAIHYFADDFYYYIKGEKMKEAAEKVEDIIASNTDSNLINKYLYKESSILGGLIYVTDSKGNLLYHTRGSILKVRPGSNSNINLSEKIGQLGNLISGLSKRLFYTQTVNDEISWLNYKHEANDLIIITSLSVPSIDDAITAVGIMFNYIIAIAFLIAIITSILVARNISRPLLELNTVAKDLSDLDFSSRSKINRQDEIGQLGKTINSMAERLQSTIARLKQELRKERDSEQVRRAFVARASHELRTPLAVISGYTEALQDGIIDNEEEEKQYYYIIKKETEKLNSLVQDMLELTRLENPEFTINKTETNIIELINSLIKKQLILNSKDISILTVGLDDSFIINGDALRLEQAISNIFRNAKRHTPVGGWIKVKANNNAKELTISIENSGSHISEDNLPHIWDSFYTTDKGEGTSDGTGLGLSIVKNIFLKHNCLFGAENTTDGVRFWFTIGSN